MSKFYDNSEYREPTQTEHKNIAYFLRRNHFSEDVKKQTGYYDESNKYVGLSKHTKKLILGYLEQALNGFNVEAEKICKNLGYKGKSKSNVSRLTKPLNFYLNEFCKQKKINPPIQLFYYHKNRQDDVKGDFDCHLACAEVGKQGNNRRYSYNIVSLEKSRGYATSKNIICNVDFKIKPFREMLKQEAISHLNDKLHGKGLEDYIPLDLEVGMPKEISPLLKDSHSTPEAHNRIWAEFDYENLNNPQGIYILSSEMGSGKTTFLRNLQLMIIKKTDLIPIFLDASEFEALEFKKGNHYSFLKSLSDLLDDGNNYHEFLKSHQNNIVFLVDGLDQIGGLGTEYRNLVDKLQTVMGSKVIFTSRPFAVIDQERDLDIIFLRLKPFGEKEIRSYLGEKYERAKELCKTCPEMIHIPILAYIVRSLIEEGDDGDVKNRTDLYKGFFDGIFEEYRHENLKVSEEKKVKIRNAYREISFKAIANDTPYLQKIPHLFAIGCKETDIEIDDLFKYGIANTVINRTPSTEKFIYFSHQSFQEYLAAEYISHNSNMIEQVLREKWDPKWKEVIKFLTGIKGQEIIDRILSEKDNPIHSKLFLAAELAQETAVDEKIHAMISQKIESILECPLCDKYAEEHWVCFDEAKAINRLLGRIEDSDAKIRCSAVADLGSLSDKLNSEAVGKIVNKLEDEDSDVRYLALKALGELGNKVSTEVVGRIISKLEDEDSEVRRSALDALGELSDKVESRAIEKIVGRLEDADSDVRYSALQALAKLSDKVNSEAIDKIVGKLEDDDFMVCSSALSALGALKGKINNEIIQMIVNKIEDEDFEISISALCALGQLSEEVDSKTVEEIVGKLEDDDPDVCSLALDALGRLSDKLDSETIGKIVSKLENKDHEIRRSTLYVLKELKDNIDNATIEKIVSIFKRKDYRVCRSTLHVLRGLKNKVDSETIVKIASKFENEPPTSPYLILQDFSKSYHNIDDEITGKVAGKLKADISGALSKDEIREKLRKEVDRLIALQHHGAYVYLNLLYERGILDFLEQG